MGYRKQHLDWAGRALAFAQHGADVVVHCHNSLQEAESLVQKIEQISVKLFWFKGM
jgi:NAD(P)-dependent dehydrogenase (short-subunit alcohol dehydrogenase family)